ncbi:hypothetical protein PTRA_b0302 [Pseudoalteromonas translucida KMM 520]|uniref:Uncharacterized protein n=1 Tax=Pseudoalteromonas translucida KMM 520 TaxID=1315283 RepID=A0A0U2WIE4_9GAMM|nr:hypothetical protein PTRA_b0302 [Pseudoalteromonas translucida KMM 520]
MALQHGLTQGAGNCGTVFKRLLGQHNLRVNTAQQLNFVLLISYTASD